jgi:hypothetical protein
MNDNTPALFKKEVGVRPGRCAVTVHAGDLPHAVPPAGPRVPPVAVAANGR